MEPTKDFKWPDIPNYGTEMYWRFTTSLGGEHGVVEIVSGETVWVERWVRRARYDGDLSLVDMEDITEEDVLNTADICLKALENVIAWTRTSEA